MFLRHSLERATPKTPAGTGDLVSRESAERPEREMPKQLPIRPHPSERLLQANREDSTTGGTVSSMSGSGPNIPNAAVLARFDSLWALLTFQP